MVACTFLFAAIGTILVQAYVAYLPAFVSQFPAPHVGMGPWLNKLALSVCAGPLGGLIASAFVVLSYLLEVRRILGIRNDNIWAHTPREFVSVFVPVASFVVIAGAILGLFLEMGELAMQSIAPFLGNAAVVLGGLSGGIATGIVVGPIGGWHFGRKVLPIADPVSSAIAAVPGLILFILVSATGLGAAPELARITSIMSLVVCALVTASAYVTAQYFRIDERIKAFFACWSEGRLLVGGACFGMYCGAVFGLSTSLSLVVVCLA